MTTIAQLIASHKAALAKMREMEDGPDAPKYDAAVEAESAALEALARVRCGSIEGFEEKLRYLVGYFREEPEEEDRLEAIRMAAEALLVERAIFFTMITAIFGAHQQPRRYLASLGKDPSDSMTLTTKLAHPFHCLSEGVASSHRELFQFCRRSPSEEDHPEIVA